MFVGDVAVIRNCEKVTIINQNIDGFDVRTCCAVTITPTFGFRAVENRVVDIALVTPLTLINSSNTCWLEMRRLPLGSNRLLACLLVGNTMPEIVLLFAAASRDILKLLQRNVGLSLQDSLL